MTGCGTRQSWFWIAALVVIALAVAIGFAAGAGWGPGPQTEPASGSGSSTVRARIETVLEQGTVTIAGQEQRFQVWQVEVLEGEYQGGRFVVEHGARSRVPIEVELGVGDQILVSVGPSAQGEPVASFSDFIRTGPLLALAAAFALLILTVSGWKGLRGMLGMAISFVVIIFFILPQIVAGRDPVLVSIVGSFALLASTMYIVYGWSLKSHSAVLGTLVALIITGLLATWFVDITLLTGTGAEETLFLGQFMEQPLNVRGLLLGAMIIGALGVLDDLTISQVSAVFELKRANARLGAVDLFQRAMVIGRDHVAATVNTLVLAYVGASLPLLLLFTVLGEPVSVVVNRSVVAEEIVRTLVGSFGLVAAVPITTALASWAAAWSAAGGELPAWLGPGLPDMDDSHGHSHVIGTTVAEDPEG